MEQIMELVTQIEDTFIADGTTNNREEARQMTIEIIKKVANKNEKGN